MSPDPAFVQIYTGNGKGKSTAALGLALRAAGAGMSVLIIQLMKDGFAYSEYESLKLLSPAVTVERYGNDAFVLENRLPTDAERSEAKKAINRIAEAYTRGGYDVIILDEACVAAHHGLIDSADVLRLIKNRPKTVELILTGRYCPPEWLEEADLVTEMKEIKHYFRKGITSRHGIDS